MSLKVYQQRRNFNKTPEPPSKRKSLKNNNLYVIQKHAASHLHYDLRLELDGVLKSWAIPKGPSVDPKVKRLAIHVEDHPLTYGHFEGNIPKGQYGAGTVIIWDKGTWLPENKNPKKEYQTGSLTFTLTGKKLKGLWKLIRIKSTPKNWLLIKVKDQYARSTSTKLLKQMRVEKIKIKGKKRSIPSLIKPQLATLVDSPPKGDDWLHEIKFDGYRLITFIENKKIRLMTRGNQNWTAKFPNVVKELNKLALPNMVLDGEIVVLDKNQQANFQLLQNAIKNNQSNPFVYYIFDIIYYDGYDLSTLPLIERKNILHQIIPHGSKVLRYSDHLIGSGKEIFAKSCELSLEGIVSKNIHSAYIQKRTRNWLKAKCIKRQEFIIGGYTSPQGARKCFGSLLLGAYAKNNRLIYCGHVGTGFNATSLRTIFKELKKQATPKMPFAKRPPESKNVIWTKPILVVEVEFSEWTADGILRHPSFKGIRSDKSPKDVKLEEPLHLRGTTR